ncbi:sigma-54-dependent Fis family transcriptional regulator [Clostridium formicaceticum]|uniref:Acetoin dehydrogenase operon transcriptional activator AcoR n=1 Tax=Clostridium formicaceticum TaxID=1497 RepID=A0AAC9RQP1_9CLOT|nr:sigma 54-interacting transcriptional regulator [Clostridium formicaceticum]AOY75214.1 sigma-54-dependent Fis family transcriptional regulator [Clostridium formicaceticum]ARE89647.1 Acetoin dehydrogenase operon transcriptional activator AcoR [Clostridium formicaceticum]
MDAKDYIARSHQRSIKFGVDDNRVYSSRILHEDELQKRLEANSNLIVTTEPFMNQLYNFVKGSYFFVILTDDEGCILNVIGDEDVLEVAFDLEMTPGAFMNEEHIGTNAMGTALVEGMPIQISGKEHFIKAYHRWTCSAAPIRNAEGKIIGTLNLTGYSHLVHSHTLGMVVAAAHAIEQMLNIRETNRKLEVKKRYIETIIDSITIGIFTIGPKGYMKTMNKTAMEMLGYTQQEIIGIKVEALVEGWKGIQDSVAKHITYLEEEAFLKGKEERIHCTLSAYPILDPNQTPQGIVCVIREIKKARKLANKMTGQQAYYTFDKIIGRSERFMQIIEYAKKISDSPSTVLITGESGTGKEVFAQSIHNHSSRREESFVAINCGALPRNLIESELFGYEEGAFTGAKRGGHPGKFELADGGTLFLDEIGEMPLDMQTNLLRVLEESKLFRVGGNKEIEVDVRIIAATNKDLRQEVEKGNFRRDLYYRLNVLPLKLPSLRERKEDIPLLIDYFMATKSLKLGKRTVALSKEAIENLTNLPWLGNIRELENMVEQIINAEGNHLWETGEPSKVVERAVSISQEDKLEEVENRHIKKVLEKTGGNISLAAEALGIGRNTLYRKMKKYQIDYNKIED